MEMVFMLKVMGTTSILGNLAIVATKTNVSVSPAKSIGVNAGIVV
jgi:hypothetical protein